MTQWSRASEIFGTSWTDSELSILDMLLSLVEPAAERKFTIRCPRDGCRWLRLRSGYSDVSYRVHYIGHIVDTLVENSRE